MKQTQPELLPNDTRPTAFDVDGSGLHSLLERLKAQGVIVLSMHAICVARWRVAVSYPVKKTSKESF